MQAARQSRRALSSQIAGIRNEELITLGPLPLDKITVPTLVISARDDGFGTLPAARHFTERIPGAKLAELESGGHLMVGRGAKVERAIGSFLRKIR